MLSTADHNIDDLLEVLSTADHNIDDLKCYLLVIIALMTYLKLRQK